jgi:hypothetical protein
MMSSFSVWSYETGGGGVGAGREREADAMEAAAAAQRQKRVGAARDKLLADWKCNV